ncbi:phospholipase D-like domain-containing protein [Microcoleus sp. D2_18a_D3]|uniref:phospholipase D-like domain-containing protein n=1 Tax=Microcoleus sp. D2_18a_D3 TaxID=3055330 RepID=UPI002FCF5CAC
MPILFNEPDSDSLLNFIKEQVTQASSLDEKKWVFYAITCYFNPDVIINLVGDIKKILHDTLSEVHLLVDADEWIKQPITISNFINIVYQKLGCSEIREISLTPIACRSKLFHAKSYALISSKPVLASGDYNGFALVTSGNFTRSGLTDNVEIGQIVDDPNSLDEFVKLFIKLKHKYALSPQQEAEHQKFQSASQFLAQGKFYHTWHPSLDLKFRLTLSAKEKERLYELANNEETRKNIEDFTLNQIKSITKDPINLKSMFNICPKPIPGDFWGTYSIDTLLGQWVPNEISQLIEDEVNLTKEIFKDLIQEISNSEKIKEYYTMLQDFVDRKFQEKVIELDSNNLLAVDTWRNKVDRILNDKNLLNTFICDYEPIEFPRLEPDLVFKVYQRIKDFYHKSDSHIGIGKLFAQFHENSDFSFNKLEFAQFHENRNFSFNEVEFEKLVAQAKNRLEENRIGDLKEIESKQKFRAFQFEEESTIVKGYKRINGIFLNKDDKIILYKDDINDEKVKQIAIDSLIVFKKQQE